MEKVTIQVNGMSCQHCVSSVKQGLANVKGVKEVHVSLEKNQVDVTYEQEKVTLSTIKNEIEDQGYDVA